MSTIKNSILALFDDNITGSISAADMRIFVDTIFDSKENEIHVFENLSELINYRLDTTKYPIQKFDVIIITDHNNTNQITERGVYIALKAAPGDIVNTDVMKIGNLNYDEFISAGETGQLISLDSDKNLTWIEPIEGYFIEGTDNITNILNKRPPQKGPIWIASNDEPNAPVPGFEGDGYSWDGEKWNNIGPLRGPEGNVKEVAFATQSEVNTGYIDYKAVSPKTFNNSLILSHKEDNLGFPPTDGMMLVSDTAAAGGNRGWVHPVKKLNDLEDIDYSLVNPNDILIYNGGMWNAGPQLQKIIELNDTPTDYGMPGQVLAISPNKLSFTYANNATQLSHLSDVSDSLTPYDNYVLKYNGVSNQWVAEPDTAVLAGTSSRRPINSIIGTMYFDTSIDIPIWFNGNHWVDANGTQR
jgi:hypothetical protein